LGGLAVGPLLDRFDKRAVLIADSLFRATAVATIPITAAAGGVPGWLPFAVAGVYGLLKMVPLVGALLGPAAMVMTAVAGVPALLLLRGRRVRSRPSAS
jgi:hypothetical protein